MAQGRKRRRIEHENDQDSGDGQQTRSPTIDLTADSPKSASASASDGDDTTAHTSNTGRDSRQPVAEDQLAQVHRRIKNVYLFLYILHNADVPHNVTHQDDANLDGTSSFKKSKRAQARCGRKNEPVAQDGAVFYWHLSAHTPDHLSICLPVCACMCVHACVRTCARERASEQVCCCTNWRIGVSMDLCTSLVPCAGMCGHVYRRVCRCVCGHVCTHVVYRHVYRHRHIGGIGAGQAGV